MHGSRCIASATNENTRVRILKKAHRVPNQGSVSLVSRRDRSNTCRRSASTTAGRRSNKSARTSSRVESPCAAGDRTIRSPGNTLVCCEMCVWNSRGTGRRRAELKRALRRRRPRRRPRRELLQDELGCVGLEGVPGSKIEEHLRPEAGAKLARVSVRVLEPGQLRDRPSGRGHAEHQRSTSHQRSTRGAQDQYEKILGEYSFGEFMLVAAGFHMQSDGKVPTPVCARADAWFRRVASSSPRAVLGISEPTEAELKKQAAFQGKARAKVMSWVT